MDTKIKSLFIQFLEKTIPEKEEEFLLKWIKEHPENWNQLREIRQIWILSDASAKFNDEFVQKEWNQFQDKILHKKTIPPGKTFNFWHSLPRLAAVFLLGAVFSMAVFYTLFSEAKQELVYQEINTPAGAKSQITLPDGSRVWLNAGSTLKYSNQFGKKQREVFLTGEAFFKVTPDKSNRFVVQASDLQIKAYGTSFNVKSYSDENTVEATLIEGSIGIKRINRNNSSADEVILEPNQRVVYYKPAQKTTPLPAEDKTEEKQPELKKGPAQNLTYMISKGIDPKPFTSWKDGIVVITSKTLDELAIILQRKYDVKIYFENDLLKKLKFTGSIENETVEQVIEAIGIAANIDYTIDEREVTFKEKIKRNK